MNNILFKIWRFIITTVGVSILIVFIPFSIMAIASFLLWETPPVNMSVLYFVLRAIMLIGFLTAVAEVVSETE